MADTPTLMIVRHPLETRRTQLAELSAELDGVALELEAPVAAVDLRLDPAGPGPAAVAEVAGGPLPAQPDTWTGLVAGEAVHGDVVGQLFGAALERGGGRHAGQMYVWAAAVWCGGVLAWTVWALRSIPYGISQSSSYKSGYKKFEGFATSGAAGIDRLINSIGGRTNFVGGGWLGRCFGPSTEASTAASRFLCTLHE